MKTSALQSWLCSAILLCLLCIIPATLAQTDAPAQVDTQAAYQMPQETQNFLLELLTKLAVSHPIVATIIGVMGSMRLWAKPFFSMLHAVVDLTATKYDDGLWASCYTFMTTTRTGRTLTYLLDWFASVRIKPVVKDVPQGELNLGGKS